MKQLFLFLGFLFTLTTLAQENPIHFGIKAGGSISMLRIDITNSNRSSPHLGFQGGVFMEFRISKRFGIQPEALFSMQGLNTDFDIFETNGWEKIKLNYINIPVMANYHFRKVKGFTLQIGPQIGFLLSAKEEGTVIDSETNDYVNYQTDVKDFYKSFDVAVCAGVQYEFNFKLIVAFRGNLGLYDIIESSNNGNSKRRNSVFHISAGYTFM